VWRACRRGLSGGYEVHLTGTRPTRGRRWDFVAIDDHIHGVLTLGHRATRSGGDNRLRSSRTFFEGGSVVMTAVAAMGGGGSGNRTGLAYCSRSGGRLGSHICVPREYGEADKWGTSGGWQGIAE